MNLIQECCLLFITEHRLPYVLVAGLNPFNLSASGSHDSLSTLNPFRYLHVSKT